MSKSRRAEYREAFKISMRLMDVVLGHRFATGKEGAQLRVTIGKFLGNFYELIQEASIGQAMLDCFEAAYVANISVQSLELVRKQALSEAPKYTLGNALVNASIIYAFSYQSKIVVNTEYDRRERIEALMKYFTESIDEVKIVKSNSFFVDDYRNYVALSALLFNHLSSVVRQLPRVVQYKMKVNYPALALANRIYGDGSRSEELVRENSTIHPAFMQRDIMALSE